MLNRVSEVFHCLYEKWKKLLTSLGIDQESNWKRSMSKALYERVIFQSGVNIHHFQGHLDE